MNSQRPVVYIKLTPPCEGFIWSNSKELRKTMEFSGFTTHDISRALALQTMVAIAIAEGNEVVIAECPHHIVDEPPYNIFVLFYRKAGKETFEITPEIKKLIATEKKVCPDEIEQKILLIENGEYQGPSKKEVNESKKY